MLAILIFGFSLFYLLIADSLYASFQLIEAFLMSEECFNGPDWFKRVINRKYIHL